MSDRFITAVVLGTRTTTPRSLDATLRAVAAQTRPADRIVCVLPAGTRESLENTLETAAADGRLQEILDVPSMAGPAAAVREVLDLLVRSPHADRGAEPSTQSAEGAAPAVRGRRARAIDHAEQERRLRQEAEHTAQIPLRLREDRPRIGRRSRREAAVAGESWLWFIPVGSDPGAGALAAQLETVAGSPRTAIVGVKRLILDDLAEDAPEGSNQTADHAAALLDVGLSLTHGGRIATGIDPGEIDQGQADWREDVLAVPLAGMLVREDSLRDLGGLDPALPAPWAEIDLCHRTWRSGQRVAVKSAARVLDPSPEQDDAEAHQTHRRGQILMLLKHRSFLGVLALLIILPFLTAGRALIALFASRPRLAAAEIGGWLGAMRGAGGAIRRGAAARRRARVSRSRLAPLYLPRGEDLRQQVQSSWQRIFADDDETRRRRRTRWGVGGTRDSIEDHDYGRHLAWTGVLAIIATVLSLIALRSLFGRGDLVGPGFVAWPERFRDAFAAAWSTWIPTGLGSRGPADPLLRLLGSVPLPGGFFLEAVIFAAIPLAALAAWWAAGAATRAVGARLVAAVIWALAPPFLAALIVGAWPLLLVHVLLPLLALGVARAIGLPRKQADAWPGAAALAGLCLLVIGAVQPVLVLLAAVAVIMVAIRVPGRRWRLLWVFVPSVALHAPYLPTYLDHPRLVLGVGATDALGAPATVQDLMALWPVAAPGRESLAALIGATGAQVLLMLPMLLLVPAALIAVVLSAEAGRVARYGALLTALTLLVVLWARSTPVGVEHGVVTPVPLHALASVLILGLAVGAVSLYDTLACREGEIGTARRAVSTVIAACAAAACALSVIAWGLLLPGTLQIQRGNADQVPAAAADAGRSEQRGRVLVLQPGAERETAHARVLVQGADTAAQHSTIVDLRRLETVARGKAPDADAGDSALREAASALLSRGAVDSPAALRTLAIGYVVVPGDEADNAALISALDASPALEKVTQTVNSALWRVADAAPRAEVRDGSATIPLRSQTVTAQGDISAAEHERTLVLSERAESQWRATVDGTALTPVTVDGWAQGFTIPPGLGGEVLVERHQPAVRIWQVLLLIAVVLTALMALPWRRRPHSTDPRLRRHRQQRSTEAEAPAAAEDAAAEEAPVKEQPPLSREEEPRD